MELSNGIYQPVDQLDSLLAHTEALLDSFDNSLNKVTQTVEELNEQVLVFNSGLQLIYELRSIDVDYPYRENVAKTSAGIPNYTDRIESGYDRNLGKESETESSNGLIKAVEGIGEFADNAKKVVSVFEEFSPKMKRLGTVLEAISNLSEGGLGAAKLISAAETGITATEGIATTGELMAGATGIAEAGAAFGPPGWVVAGAALAVAGVTAAISDDDEKRKKKRKRRKEEEREEAQSQSALQTFQMSGVQADQYLA